MSDRVKLTAKLRDKLPKVVKDRVKAIQKQYRTRNGTLVRVEADSYRHYLGEGEKYKVFHVGTGKSTQFNMMSENTLHAGGQPISYKVGERMPTFPAGTFVIENHLFLGKMYITVYQYEGEAIEDSASKPEPKVEVIF